MSANKQKGNIRVRNKKKREARMIIVSELYKKGFTMREMRTEVMKRLNLETYSLNTVKKDVDRLRKAWREDNIENMDDAIMESVIKYKKMQSEAWEQWELSKQPKTVRMNKQKGTPRSGMGADGAITTTEREVMEREEQKLGDPRYLQVIGNAQKEIDKLLGKYEFEEKEKIEINYNIGALSDKQKAALRAISDDIIENTIPHE